MKTQSTLSPNGLNGLPVDSIVTAWGFGAEPQKVRILAPQLSDGRYSVALVKDGSITSKIHPDDITIVHDAPSPSVAAHSCDAMKRLPQEFDLYMASMGKIFRVTHVCPDVDSANAIMENNHDTAMIAEDPNGFVYLAEQYGHVCPSAIIDDIRHRNS